MSRYGKNAVNMMLFILSVIAITVSVPVQAGHAGAFIGGIAVARVGQNMRDRNDYEEDQAYYAQQQANAAQQQANAASRASTPQQKIKQLDDLLAGGYITQAEYNSKKEDILNNL
jgi:membrane protease subunit (stomatin/prohibitin family)